MFFHLEKEIEQISKKKPVIKKKNFLINWVLVVDKCKNRQKMTKKPSLKAKSVLKEVFIHFLDIKTSIWTLYIPFRHKK